MNMANDSTYLVDTFTMVHVFAGANLPNLLALRILTQTNQTSITHADRDSFCTAFIDWLC